MTSATYYQRAGARLFHHLRGRPVMLKRWPAGLRQSPVYQRDKPDDAPAWARIARVTRPFRSLGEDHRTLLMDREQLVSWASHVGPLEFHQYQHEARSHNHPRAVWFDLDPGAGVGVLQCALAALLIHRTLEHVGLPSFVKTSGSKGLHVAIPLQGVTYDQVRQFARPFASVLAHANPALLTHQMPRAQHAGRVFMDWTLNGPRRTIAAPWTWRHTAGEPLVSTPIEWDRVLAAVRTGNPQLLSFSPDHALLMPDPWLQMSAHAQRSIPSLAA